jgi:6-pyruvoyltetrahydropterin/6-carboxytetrahydropterin synthase
MWIQFKRRFSMAHRLRFDRSSKCMVPHGHNEFVTVSLQPKAGSRGTDWGGSNYAASFADLKRHWHGFVDDALDHAFQLGHDDPMIGYFQAHEPELLPRLLVIKGDPTTEAVAVALFMKLDAILAKQLPQFECARLELEETPTNSIVVTPQDVAACPIELGAWCRRADLSINDLLPPESWSTAAENSDRKSPSSSEAVGQKK